jgi:hypothetical protein
MNARVTWKVALSLGMVLVTVAAVAVLAGTYYIILNDNSYGNEEGGWFARSGLVVCGVLGAVLVVATLLSAAAGRPAGGWLVAGCVAAFVGVAASCALVLAVAAAMESQMDPGELGRTLFPVVFAAALFVSVAFGVAAIVAVTGATRGRAVAGASVVMIVLMLGSWAYLATGASEFNQCWVNDEFPLATDHVCAGY